MVWSPLRHGDLQFDRCFPRLFKTHTADAPEMPGVCSCNLNLPALNVLWKSKSTNWKKAEISKDYRLIPCWIKYEKYLSLPLSVKSNNIYLLKSAFIIALRVVSWFSLHAVRCFENAVVGKITKRGWIFFGGGLLLKCTSCQNIYL